MSRLTGIVAVVWLSSGVAYGQALFVDSHYITGFDPSWSSNSTTYVDIPGSEKTITLPPGKAVISWTAFAQAFLGIRMNARIRPVIGGNSPSEGTGLGFDGAVTGALNAGSWSVTTGGGEVEVKLQVKKVFTPPGDKDSIQFGALSSVTWTLVVYQATVPVISQWGLVVMLLLILTAATAIFARRRAVPA